MKLQLKTDFLDYYDHWFDVQGQLFERISTSGMNRLQMLDFLSERQVQTVPYGYVHEFRGHSSFEELVVYTNPMSHRGEGKVKLTVKEACDKYPDNLCSLFLSENQKAVSYRHLQIGEIFVWLKYESLTDWRSNNGDVEIEIIDYFYERPYAIDIPLFAIDFIMFKEKLYSMDFNIAPQIKGTGIETLIKSKEIVELIKNSLA